jgi:hypothetical protein
MAGRSRVEKSGNWIMKSKLSDLAAIAAIVASIAWRLVSKLARFLHD